MGMKKEILIILLLFFWALSQPLTAQQKRVTQSYEKRKFIFSFDSDKNFLNGSDVRFFGFKVGLQFDDKFRVGMGLQILADFIPVRVVVNEGEHNEYTTDGKLDITLMTSYYERILHTSTRWEFTASLHHGIGGVSRRYIDTVGVEQQKSAGGFVLLTPAVEGHYKFFSWLGIGAGVGYRIAFYNDKKVQQLVNSPIYVLKMKLFLGELYKAIFKKEKPWDEYRRQKRMKRR